MAAFVGGCGGFLGGRRDVVLGAASRKTSVALTSAPKAKRQVCVPPPPSMVGLLSVSAAGQKAAAAPAKRNQYMGTSKAPKIVLTNGASDMTRKIKLEEKVIGTDLATATGIKANMALWASLNPVKRLTTPKVADEKPAYKKLTGNPVEDYYPSNSWRNLAPVISLEANKVSVAFEKIDAASNGIKASSSAKPFWKLPANTKNYSAPDAAPAKADADIDIVDDSEYQKYFPARIRNKAPGMELRRPTFANTEDPSAYFMLRKDTVPLNMALAEKLLTKLGRQGDGTEDAVEKPKAKKKAASKAEEE